ncbi:hypothetical protein V8E36_001105 [Tilletia maclaganii]
MRTMAAGQSRTTLTRTATLRRRTGKTARTAIFPPGAARTVADTVTGTRTATLTVKLTATFKGTILAMKMVTKTGLQRAEKTPAPPISLASAAYSRRRDVRLRLGLPRLLLHSPSPHSLQAQVAHTNTRRAEQRFPDSSPVTAASSLVITRSRRMITSRRALRLNPGIRPFSSRAAGIEHTVSPFFLLINSPFSPLFYSCTAQGRAANTSTVRRRPHPACRRHSLLASRLLGLSKTISSARSVASGTPRTPVAVLTVRRVGASGRSLPPTYSQAQLRFMDPDLFSPPSPSPSSTPLAESYLQAPSALYHGKNITTTSPTSSRYDSTIKNSKSKFALALPHQRINHSVGILNTHCARRGYRLVALADEGLIGGWGCCHNLRHATSNLLT